MVGRGGERGVAAGEKMMWGKKEEKKGKGTVKNTNIFCGRQGYI